MEFSDKFRKFWWVLLIVTTGAFLVTRWPELQSGDPTSFDLAVFAAWVALMAIPIFGEVEMFGVKFSQALGEVKEHVSSEVASVKATIRASLSSNVTVNNAFDFAQFTSQDRDKVQADVNETFESTAAGVGAPTVTAVDPIEPLSQDADYMVRVRVTLDRELRQIYGAVEGCIPPPFQPLLEIVQHLVEKKVISEASIESAVAMVYTYCTLVAHGQRVGDDVVRFVRETAPKLVVTLQVLKERVQQPL